MDQVLKRYIAVTLIIIVAVCAMEIIISDDWLDWLIIGVGMCALYPCLVSGLYMYLEGRGAKSINGINLSDFSDTELRNYSSFFGFYMAIGTAVLMIGLGILLNNMIIGIVLMVVSIAVMLVPALTMKERGRKKKFVEKSVSNKVIIFLMVSVLAVVPMVVLENSSFNTETVTVDFGTDSFNVKAPMFDHTFEYDKVEMLGYDPDFDKGTRVIGYATPTISSGTFKNGQFGSYQLASYTKVDTCIFFEYEGKYYAFNQISDRETLEVYEILKSKVDR